MADVTYLIRIEDEAGAGEGESPSITRKGKTEKKTSGKTTSSNINGEIRDVKHYGKTALASATALANAYVTAEISRISVRTGHSTLQRQISYNYGLARRIALSTSGVIMTIAKGNPIGAVIGLGSLAMRTMHIMNAQTDLNIQRDVENIGLEQSNIRAGAGGNRNEEKY